ncbi:MAG: divergent polysaccharide deacetylase family protein [PVC group bacterium]
MNNRYSLLILLIPGLLAGCAAPEADIFTGPPAPVLPADPPVLNQVDMVLAGVLGGLIPPWEEWPPREEVSPAPPGSVIVTRSLPLSSLAYFSRLRPRLHASLEEAGISRFEISRYPSPGGEGWEVSVAVDGQVMYRVELVQKIAARVAVIIDDCGNSLKNRDLLFTLDYPLTVAILPGLAHSAAVDRLAAEHGFEVMLHCPLEAIDPDIPLGPGSIDGGMAPDEMSRVFEEDIRSVPHAVGMNNHMGSAFTADTEAMRLLMDEVRKKGLFFVDSLTVRDTVTRETAEAAGVRHAFRDIFLDHEMNDEFIIRQFGVLKRKALHRGCAIAIGHDRQLTLEIVSREIPSLADDNIQLVPVSDLIE